MNYTITIAATQMDANVAPMTERLARAETLVTQAAAAGAQLVVLPELFNLGYAYADENFHYMKGAASQVFGATFSQQTAWLGVPAVNTAGCGQITTAIPNGRAAFLAILPLAPHLAKHLPYAHRLRATYTFVPGCKVVGADGHALAGLTQAQGETFALAEVALPETRPIPRGRQPVPPIPRPVYWFADVLIPGLMLGVYRQGARRAWGARMAPVRPATQRWLLALGAVALIDYVVGWLRGRRAGRRN